MKIKCPSCSKILGIPESAAGKVVKCPCGKQLKAPAGPGKPAAPAKPSAPAKPAAKKAAPAQKRPTPPRPTAQRPAPQRPAARPAQRPPAAPIGADAGIFDELTDTDLSGVRAVVQPGKKIVAKKSKVDPLAKYGSEVDKEKLERKKEIREGASREIRTSIGILLCLGMFRFAVGMFFMLTAGHDAEAMLGGEATVEEVASLTFVLQIVYGIQVAIGVVFLVCAGLIFMLPMSCALVAITVFVLAEIVGLLIFPFDLINIRGWIVRAVIFGALIQTINNASYYRFVKMGGRDED